MTVSIKENSMRGVCFYQSFRRMILICLALALPYATAERVYVFYPATFRSQAMQQKLLESGPKNEITVFERFKDFESKVASDTPDAIIAPAFTAGLFEKYNVKLNGTSNGSTNEDYVAVSINSKPDLDSIGNGMIGVLELCSRRDIQKYLTAFFPTPPKFKTVAKVEDLLPLLAFGMVDAVLVPVRYAEYLKQTSNLTLVTTPVKNPQDGIVVCAIRKGINGESIGASLRSMNKTNCSMFGVEQWK
jgi:hypothetical protein